MPVANCSDYPGPQQQAPAVAAPMSDPIPAGAVRAAAGPYTWSNVAIEGGGFVSGIAFSAAAPKLVYARTDVGAAYRYDVTRERWRPLTDWVGANEQCDDGINDGGYRQPTRGRQSSCPYTEYWGAGGPIRRYDFQGADKNEEDAGSGTRVDITLNQPDRGHRH